MRVIWADGLGADYTRRQMSRLCDMIKEVEVSDFESDDEDEED